MALSGTLVKQVTVISDIEVFLEIFRYKLHDIPEMSPDFIKAVSLQDGEWGVVGSVFVYLYIQDGVEKAAKEVIEEIDDAKKVICYRVIEGDLMNDYKTFSKTVHFETKGNLNLITWTFNYEKINVNVEDPESFADCFIDMTKDIDTYYISKST